MCGWRWIIHLWQNHLINNYLSARGHSLQLSQHRGQHFGQLIHGWIAIPGHERHMWVHASSKENATFKFIHKFKYFRNRLDDDCTSIRKWTNSSLSFLCTQIDWNSLNSTDMNKYVRVHRRVQNQSDTHPLGKGGAPSCWPGASTWTTAKCWVISCMSS